MAVGVQGRLDAAVPESLHDCPRVGSLGDEHRGIAMTEVMEADLRVEADF